MNDATTIQRLRTELHQHGHNYYVLNSPTISDADYDRLFRELQTLEAAHPELADPNSPTSRVGARTPNIFNKVKHNVPMMSLENSFTAAEAVHRIVSEAGPSEVILEPKIDGLALSLRYDNGIFVQAVTRGDHEIGDDVTANVRTIGQIPLVIMYDKPLEIRGEAYLSKASFEKINKELEAAGEEIFANARNAAAGTMKQKDSEICAKRGLSFVGYSVVSPRQHGIKTQLGLLEFIKSLGFPIALPVASFHVIHLDKEGESNLESHLIMFDAKRKNLPYDTDGCVIKINSLDKQAELGNKTRVPRWATAFKYPAEKATTVLNSVTCQIGRRGTITPVAELKAVEIAGVTVRRASLCNQDEIDRLGINVGDEVTVERAGEVIPKVIALKTKISHGIWKMPEFCPCCKTQLVRDGAHYFCPNEISCADQVRQRLQHAVGKGALDWDGFGPAAVEVSVAMGITKLSQLFELADSKLDELFKPAFVRKFKKERERVKTSPLWRKINALGIDNIGQTASKELCEAARSLEDIIDLGPEKLRSILGPVASKSFIDYVAANVAELDKLNELGYTFVDTAPIATVGGKLSGKTFCLTGAMLSGTRPQVAITIEQHGGKVKGSVGKDLSYLVAGDGGGANKANAAKKLGTQVITEEELYQMIGIPMPLSAVVPLADEF
jgi:DNA ligase (NAD+)